ncbi:MAG: hypothetical protein IT454_15815 [Planctomycetes bacterium]|nr:hypothetical protein [Planctomycetota bacterium]
METERVLWIVLLWSTVAAGLYLLRRRSPFHLPVLALGVTALVGSFFPIASAFIEPSSWRNLDFLSPDIVVATQAQYACFALGLLASVLLSAQVGWLAPARAVEEGAPRADSDARDLCVATLLVLTGLALYGLYVQRVGTAALFDREDYAHKYLLSQGLGPLQFGLPTAIVGCLWAEASDLPRALKNMFLPVALAIIAWTVAFISVRTNAVILVLGYLSIVAWRRRLELRGVRLSLLCALLALYLALESFALFRGVYRGDLAEALWILQTQGERAIASAVGGSELSHPFVTAGEILRGREAGELAGRSLLDGIAACLPRGLYPERPLMLSEQFVRSNYAELAARGGGAAFSLVAEGWLNFGAAIGPALFGLALGGLLAWVERRRELAPEGLVARVLPFFVFYVAMQHRNEFGTLFKQVFMVALVVLPCFLAGDAIAGSRVRSRLRPRSI